MQSTETGSPITEAAASLTASRGGAQVPRCRSCASLLGHDLLDLGYQPLSNAYRSDDDSLAMEATYPLRLYVCETCWLVQVAEVEIRESIFDANYAYFSSYSTTWLEHAHRYADEMIARRNLTERSLVVEVASNDGYLLRWFHERGVRVHGIDPAAGCAAAASELGVSTTVAFFGLETANELVAMRGRADVMVANNVLAHVPDINDFIAGFAVALARDGIATFEFPHLAELIEKVAYDTIYHEHFSYLSVIALERLFTRHGLAIVDVERLPTHGGSLRLHVMHAGAGSRSAAVDATICDERAAGLDIIATYTQFAERVRAAKHAFLRFLLDEARAGRKVAAYGAAAKGNTLLNYCGVRSDLIAFVVDRNPHKVGHFLPGSHLSISPVERLFAERPDTIVILPWNLTDEITAQLPEVREWGGRFAVAVPTARFLP